MLSTSDADLDSGLTGTERAVLRALADGRQRTVADVCAELSAARSSVVHALSRLRAAGVVVEHASGRPARGRPARGWSIAAPPGPLAVVLAAAHGFLAGVVRADG